MKRYRLFGFDFDSTPDSLTMEIRDEWEEQVKEQHRKNKAQAELHFMEEYGRLDWESKRRNIIDLGSKPMSIIAFHNRFAHQVRTAFIAAAYYPALVGACALGERILNHLVLALRDDFRGTLEYKKVYRKDSFDNWRLAIDTLEAWGVLLPEVVTSFKELEALRHQSIHFRPDTDKNDRDLALRALRLLYSVIQGQFCFLGKKPWFMGGIPGEVYISREAQDWPFVRKVYLPNCFLAGPHHWMDVVEGRWTYHDPEEYDDREVTDDEWRQMRLEFNQRDRPSQ